MPSNFKVSSDIDTLLRKQTKEEAAAFLGIDDVAAVWGQVTGTLSNQTDLQGALDAKAPIANATFTGTTTIPSADITTADFNAGGLGGEVSWNNQEKTLDLVTGSDNVTVQLGQEVVLYARNNSGATLSDGNVVMISGSQGNNPTISLAQANTVENARKTIGVVTQIIPNNSNGFVTLIGKVRDLVLDNGTYSEGDVVYLSDTVAGGLTSVEPSISVEVGHVLATSNGGNTNGVLEVQINNGAGTYELEQTLNAAIATKAPIASPTFTGDITVGNIQIGQSSSSTVVDLLDASSRPEARDAIGAVNYPYTTDFQSGTEQTRNLTSITNSSGYYMNNNLTSIYVGSNVTSIGNQAFFASQNLTSVTIPDSVTSIGNSAFSSCTGLPSITIPNSVTSIGNNAFNACSNLTSVTISNSVTSIETNTFYACSSLTSVTIPNSVTSLGSYAFYVCTGLTSITIGDSVTSIGSFAFFYCTSLPSITIPNSVTSIGNYVFNSCSSLTSVTIGNSVTSIGSSAFNYCSSLTSITIPSSVTSIGSGAFNYCSSLATINCLATTAPTLAGSGQFNGVAATDIHVPVGATGYGTTYGGLTVVADL